MLSWYPQEVTQEDIELFELDMARMYEDASWEFDGVNAELQELAEEAVE